MNPKKSCYKYRKKKKSRKRVNSRYTTNIIQLKALGELLDDKMLKDITET